MNELIKALKEQKVLVSDGAWGTLFMDKGLEAGECPEIWNLTRIKDVKDIAMTYMAAGAQCIKTNSFGANRIKMRRWNLEDKVQEMNFSAAMISRQAAGDRAWVLGSIGPTGKILMMEEVSPEEMYQVFCEQCIALQEGGADAILIETMSDLQEAMIAIKAAKENTSCNIICTMAFDKTLSGEYRTMMGVSPAEMTLALQDSGVDILGANCGRGMESMVDITREIRSVNHDIPVLIHANAGLPEFKDGKTKFPETPETMAGFVLELIKAGAGIIGGCCGTTPEHIREIARVVKSVNPVNI